MRVSSSVGASLPAPSWVEGGMEEFHLRVLPFEWVGPFIFSAL